MSDEKSSWKPDDEEALKALIRATLQSAGPIDAAHLPSKIRERIKAHVKGDIDVEAYVKQILKEDDDR